MHLTKVMISCIIIIPVIGYHPKSIAQTQYDNDMAITEMNADTFPWRGQLSKEHHRSVNPELWDSVTSFSDYSQIEQQVISDMIPVMEEGRFLQLMTDYLVESYRQTPELHEILLEDARLSADAFRSGDKPDLYNLVRYSVTNRASEFYISNEIPDPFHELLKSSEFFHDHVKAATTVRYLELIGYNLPPITLTETVNFNRKI